MSLQSRRWVFTLNNPSLEEVCSFNEWIEDESVVKYAVVGDEVGDQGTPHVQGFIIFSRPKRRRAVSLLVPRAFLDVARGTSRQAADYCMKEGKFVEYGNFPADHEIGSISKDRWANALNCASEGKFEEIPSDLYTRYRNTYRSIYEEKNQAKECINSLDHIWIYGGTGLGKSKWCWEHHPGAYRKSLNKWWDLYTNKPDQVVVIEDIDPSHGAWSGQFFKIWSDHYPFLAERKGGTMCIRPKMIIVTSNYLPKEIWTDHTMLLPLMRRFKIKTIVEGQLVDYVVPAERHIYL